MGSGRASIDISLICKLAALILCAISIGLNNGIRREELVSNSIIYATGGFIIVVVIFLGWSVFKGEIDSTFVGCVMLCGGIWNIGAGIGVILYYLDFKSFTSEFQLAGGCFALVGGIVMIADTLHCLGVF